MLAAMLSMVPACRVARCAPGTLLLTIEPAGSAEQMRALHVEIGLSDGTMNVTDVPVAAGHAQGTLEIDFPGGYPRGQVVDIRLTATDADQRQVGASHTQVTLADACESVAVPIGDGQDDSGCLLVCPAGACGQQSDHCGSTLDCGVCMSLDGGLDLASDGDASLVGDMPPPGLLPAATQVVGGGLHACAIVTNGNVMCWGLNETGQLGVGDETSSAAPQPVSLPSAASALALGYQHSCALVAGGKVLCWGKHGGVVIDPKVTGFIAKTPVTIDGLNSLTITQLAAGRDHTCALDSTGGVWCWGANDSGQLGNNVANGNVTPTKVTLPTASQITAGNGFSCALVGTGVKCWGAAVSNGGSTSTSTPVDVQLGGNAATHIQAGGSSACALTTMGVRCWGSNNHGQLGDGTQNDTNAPVAVIRSGGGALSGATSLAGGETHFCASLGTSVVCWGSNQFGQLANGMLQDSLGAVPVLGLTGAELLASSLDAMYALTPGRGIQAWGTNREGELSQVPGALALAPTAAPLVPTGITKISPGIVTCSVAPAGASCFGYDLNGQLGNGGTQNSLVPVAVGGAALTQVASYYHACGVVQSNSELFCWGPNDTGQLGDGSNMDRPSPALIAGNNYFSVGVGRVHTCALTTTSNLKCWGSNSSGQLGYGAIGDTSFSPLPTGSFNSNNAAGHTEGAYFTCGFSIGAGNTKCWGEDGHGQVSGAKDAGGNPTVTGTQKLAAGYAHVCALVGAGVNSLVKCWGYGHDGELGNGMTNDAAAPVVVPGLTGATELSAGDYHTCALVGSGATAALKCWGSNRFGQLGVGTLADSAVPVAVALPNPPAHVFAGHAETYVVDGAGSWLVFGRMKSFSTTIH